MSRTKKIIRYDVAGQAHYFVGDREVSSEEFAPTHEIGAGVAPMTPPPSCWPMASWAAAVHPKQVTEQRKADLEVGVTADYDRDGCPVFTDREHRRRYLKAHKLYDRDAGYGDPVPESSGQDRSRGGPDGQMPRIFNPFERRTRQNHER